MKELISVIIPVYNVENYLKKCIESVVNQSYQNLEIILIDDGSTDSSGTICDDYLKKDERIKVIHKKHGDVSKARNEGIKKAKGEYLTFIDSDDWIPLNSIEILYKELKTNHADISSGLIKETYTRNLIEKESEDYQVKVYDKVDAMEELLYLHGFSNSASAKLYKKNLFKEIQFPIDKHYEDLGTVYKIFNLANKIVLLNIATYYYYQNTESIMHKKYNSKRLEAFDFSKDIVDFIETNYKSILNAAIFRLYFECISILNVMPYNSKDKKNILKVIRKYRKSVLKDKKLYTKQRFLCFASLFGQPGIKLAFKLKNILKKIK